ncbi:MAG: ABC transporter substrate-binding protein [Chloroflexota bacterium]
MPITIMTTDRYASAQLVSGAVKIQGFDVNIETPQPSVATVFNAFLQNLSYEAVDLPLTNYIIARDLGKPLTALPAFPTRFQPLMGPMVNRKSGIKTVDDLIGKRVGVSGFAFNPATYLRSMLVHLYDLPIEKIIWVEGEPNSMSNIPYARSRRFTIEKAPRNIMEMVNDGEVDAVFMSDGGIEPTDTLDRLFADPWVEIRKFYEATGVFPVNAAITVRNDVLEANPGFDRALVVAYQQGWDRYAAEAGESKHMELAVSEMKALGVLPLKEGFTANRKNIAWIAHACYEQGLVQRLWEPEELFPQID